MGLNGPDVLFRWQDYGGTSLDRARVNYFDFLELLEAFTLNFQSPLEDVLKDSVISIFVGHEKIEINLRVVYCLPYLLIHLEMTVYFSLDA